MKGEVKFATYDEKGFYMLLTDGRKIIITSKELRVNEQRVKGKNKPTNKDKGQAS